VKQSNTFWAEPLEQRVLLAEASFAAFYPIEVGSKWVYNGIADGVKETDTETISSKILMLHGQKVFSRVTTSPNETSNADLENFSKTGQLQLYGFFDPELKFIFDTPIVFPRLVAAGVRQRSRGTMDVQYKKLHLPGTFGSEITIAGRQRITTPAGTFGTVKIEFNFGLNVNYHKRGGPDIDILISERQTVWLARGVGIVQSTDVTHGQSRINGKLSTDDSTSSQKLRRYSIGG